MEVACASLRCWINPILVTALVAIFGYPLIRYIKLSWCSRRVKISKQKGILITGATSGIGLALAEHFHSLGFTIFAAYYNEQEPGHAKLGALVGSGRMFLVKMDVRSEKSIEEARKQVDSIMERREIKLFCLINNAGISNSAPFEWENKAAIKELMDTNLIGAMWVTREFLLRIIQCQGRVVTVSSGLGMLPTPDLCTYCSSKSALIYFSESLQLDLDRYGVRSCCALPGNLTDKSSIVFGAVKSVDAARNKLGDMEKARYRESIERSYKSLGVLIKRRMVAGEEQEWLEFFKTNNITSFEPILGAETELKASRVGCLQRLLIGLANKLCGRVKEFGEIMPGFEQLVCLQNPPTRAYPGSSIYTHLVGPLLELTPPLVREKISLLSSLYLWQNN